jgi:cation diffusion facilitator CzcD-associated flavoprotein CzcO
VLLPLTGNPAGPKSMEEIPEYIQTLHALDIPSQDRVRARVEDVVKDPDVAKKLKPWYPSWCKRPCFHDDYLPTFNRDNVTLVDTDGRGLDRLTEDSIVAGEQSYPVDLIIFATGFRPPYGGTPAEKGNLTIRGIGGVSMTEEWTHSGPTTLHGVLDQKFPNLFLSGPWQAGTSGNYLFGVDCLGKHAAYIVAEAKRKAGRQPFAVAPTVAGAEDWGTQIMMRCAPMAGIIGCTPSYFNLEGAIDRVPPGEQTKMARSGLWGHGIEDFLAYIEAWRAEGNMKGIEVRL